MKGITTRPTSRLGPRARLIAALVLLSVLLIFGLWITRKDAGLPSSVIAYREPDLSGPPASWEDVLATLRGQASANLEPGSAIVHIRATLDDCNPASGKPGTLNFDYVQPSGHGATILLDDATPPQVLLVDKDTGLGQQLSPSVLQTVNTQMDAVKITPRQACMAAWAEGHVAGPQTFAYLQYYDSQPLVWDLTFGKPKSPNYLGFKVSSDTGQILERTAYPANRSWLPTPAKP